MTLDQPTLTPTPETPPLAVISVSSLEGGKWTPERVELLRKLWSEGLSARQIADDIGDGITRNAVIGKAHRLGLHESQPRKRYGMSVRNRPSSPRTGKRLIDYAARHNIPLEVAKTLNLSVAPIKIRLKAPPRSGGESVVVTAENVDQLFPVERRRSFLEVGYNECRYPVNHVGDDNFFFCGAEKREDSPYCERCHSWCRITIGDYLDKKQQQHGKQYA